MRKKADLAKIHALEVELGLRTATAQEPFATPLLDATSEIALPLGGRLDFWLCWAGVIAGCGALTAGIIWCAMTGSAYIGVKIVLILFGFFCFLFAACMADGGVQQWQVCRLPLPNQLVVRRQIAYAVFLREVRGGISAANRQYVTVEPYKDGWRARFRYERTDLYLTFDRELGESGKWFVQESRGKTSLSLLPTVTTDKLWDTILRYHQNSAA